VCLAAFIVVAVHYGYALGQTPNATDMNTVTYPIVDTGQMRCYSNSRQIRYPRAGRPFHGQDAQYEGNRSSYRNNGDGTVSDLVTGLMWSKAVDMNKVNLAEAKRIARGMTLGGHSDWRVPNIKELYSLMDFRGYTGFGRGDPGSVPPNAVPFINTDVFDFEYGQTSAGERFIDAQWLTSTRYVSTTMNRNETLFGVNFADGRIKGYGYKRGNRILKRFYARYVRGREYGNNRFADNGDGTVSDHATGLMWMQRDSGKAMPWQEALEYAEHLAYASHDDWRLPNAKELQSIVDYSRSPDTTHSAAVDPVFQTASIVNEAGARDYPCFWTSTTHLDGPTPGTSAVYVAFGRALGQMRGRIMDVHGAGAQRSDPKTGSPRLGHGPQADARRIRNHVRCVRGGAVRIRTSAPSQDKSKYPHSIRRQESRKKAPGRGLPRRHSRGFVQRLDSNGDGKVSRAEFDGPPHRFDHHDQNRDGYLSEDEAPKGPPPGRRGPPGP